MLGGTQSLRFGREDKNLAAVRWIGDNILPALSTLGQDARDPLNKSQSLDNAAIWTMLAVCTKWYGVRGKLQRSIVDQTREACDQRKYKAARGLTPVRPVPKKGPLGGGANLPWFSRCVRAWLRPLLPGQSGCDAAAGGGLTSASPQSVRHWHSPVHPGSLNCFASTSHGQDCQVPFWRRPRPAGRCQEQ